MGKMPDQIGAEEFILRRIHQSHASPGSTLVILPVAFRPSKADSDGLSVFREQAVSTGIGGGV